MGTKLQEFRIAKMQQFTPTHIPVLLDRCLELLAPSLQAPGSLMLDGTLGLGGHAEAALERFPGLKLLGIDRDQTALDLASARLARFGNRFTGRLGRFEAAPDYLRELGWSFVHAILLDLGVSSMQLDDGTRGFSYMRNEALDMRMNQRAGLTAAELIERSSEAELVRIFRDYGEERFARRIAKLIVESNPRPRLSGELTAIVRAAVPARHQDAGHPARRVFQALRIAVNEELDTLARALPQLIDSLAPSGRIVVLSYHSLEDEIVRDAMRKAATSGAPVDLPFEPAELRPKLRLITKGVERASESEISLNPRAKSARLRAAEKLAAAA
ncbi:MAG: rRNA ((1402)-N(4))-methyltransferase RsmH [Actinomycetota bacterium]